MTDLEIPLCLNKNILGVALSEKYEQKIEVNDFKVSMGSKKGENYTSDIYRIEVDFELNSKKIKESIIAKCMLQRPEAQKLLETYNLAGKESEMYQNILPKITSLMKEKCSPYCYFITQDQAVFFLEDMKSIGYNTADRTVGLDLEHSKIFVEKLGKFHAASMILAEEDPGIFKTFETGMFKKCKEKQIVDQVYEGGILLLIDVVSKWEGYEKIVEKLIKIKNHALESVLKCVDQPATIKVLNHGDSWTNNAMFKYKENSNVPEDIIFLDFQMGFYSGIGIDYNYFLYSSPIQEIRDNHENLLVESYYQTFSNTLQGLKYDETKIPTLQQVKDEIKAYKLYGLFASVFILPIISMERNENFEYKVEDYDEVDLRKMQFQGKMFQESIKKILLKFDEEGILDI